MSGEDVFTILLLFFRKKMKGTDRLFISQLNKQAKEILKIKTKTIINKK